MNNLLIGLPWVVSSDGVRILSDENGPDYEIASCTGMDSGHPAPIENQAIHARLISAAPDLLEVLDSIVRFDHRNGGPSEWHQLMRDAEKVINKAERIK